ncbi:hypothetical protein GCM10011495_29350 [Hymenobacter frigidus]|uniref:Uncharacterized protein n=1 Tax=Hymenobacter frigidus TaxID=1524095 RepID=A0ABQ2AA12_9BACT|nr:hypothetical protein [Hymenobacter frigidus]GGH88332.1 hypothetical protein GCM10011495_29350 [Hymenobacter frigidus]
MKALFGAVLILIAMILQTNADDLFGTGGYIGLATGAFCSAILLCGLYQLHLHFKQPQR